MATGRRTVAPGQDIASDWGNTVWDQSVQQFASAADRSTQFPAPKAGAVSWLDDVKQLETYNGTAWVGTGAAVSYTATVIGATVASPGANGYTQPLVIPARTFPWIAVVSWGGLCSVPAGTTAEVQAWKNGVMWAYTRGLPGGWSTVSGTFHDSVAAGASPTYQGVLAVLSGSGSFQIPNDARCAWLHVLALRA
jgi:hypothetical protein